MNLETKLRANAGDTYAGSWIQHEPTFGIVVVFTVPVDGGEAIVRPYIEGTPFSEITEVRQARFTLAELEARQLESIELLRGNGLRLASQTNVFENRVELFPIDPAGLQALIADGTIELPPGVVVLGGAAEVEEAE